MGRRQVSIWCRRQRSRMVGQKASRRRQRQRSRMVAQQAPRRRHCQRSRMKRRWGSSWHRCQRGRRGKQRVSSVCRCERGRKRRLAGFGPALLSARPDAKPWGFEPASASAKLEWVAGVPRAAAGGKSGVHVKANQKCAASRSHRGLESCD